MIDPDFMINLAQAAINRSNDTRKQEEKPHVRWKFCVALAAEGWKATKSEPVGEDHEVIITWQKEGLRDVLIRLTFQDQCLWLDYMHQKEQKNEHK